MKKRIKISGLVGLIVVVVLVAGTMLFRARKVEVEPEAPIRIGAILPLTGPASMLGEFMKNGIDLAVEKINLGGGINNRKIEIVYGDSKNDPKEGVTIFNRFAHIENLPVVITSMSGVTNAIIDLADRNEVVLFATTVSASGITERSDWLFRLFITADIDAKLMAEHAAREMGFRRMGIFYVNDEFGLSFHNIFKSTFEANGGSIVWSESFDRGTIDFRSHLTKLRGVDFDGIYILGYEASLGIIPRQLRELGIEQQIMSIATISQPFVLEQAGEALEGAIFTSTLFNPDSPVSEVAKEFIENHKEVYGKNPSYFTGFAYDTLMILADVLKREGYSSDRIREGLLKVKNFPGVMGNITIKPDGDADFPMVVKIIKDGKVQDIK